MIKLFAWESFAKDRVATFRVEELRQIRLAEIYKTLMSCISDALPLVAKVIVFAVYVSQVYSVINAWLTGTDRRP